MLVHLALIKITDLWPNFSPPLPPQSLESLTERCDSALLLLGEALESMDAEPMPDNIKVEDSKYHQTSFYFQKYPQNINKHVTFFHQDVPLSIEKHRKLMRSVLADQRVTELQQRGGAWLAGLTNSASGLAQRSPDCRYKTLCLDNPFWCSSGLFWKKCWESICFLFSSDLKAISYVIFLLKILTQAFFFCIFLYIYVITVDKINILDASNR